MTECGPIGTIATTTSPAKSCTLKSRTRDKWEECSNRPSFNMDVGTDSDDLGLTAEEVDALPRAPSTNLRKHSKISIEVKCHVRGAAQKRCRNATVVADPTWFESSRQWRVRARLSGGARGEVWINEDKVWLLV